MPGFILDPDVPIGPAAPGPPGSLITQDSQWEIWRSDDEHLLGGPGTYYANKTIKGLSHAPRRRFTAPKSNDHGSMDTGADKYEERVISAEITVIADTIADLQTLKVLLGNVFRPMELGDNIPMLIWKAPGMPLRRLTGRPDGCDWPYDWQTRALAVPVGWDFVALDPFFYSIGENQVSTLIAAGQAGITFDVTNAGDVPVAPIIEIDGPALNPRILNNNWGAKSIKIDTNLLGGETLVIDTSTFTVKKAGVNVTSLVRLSDNQWWKLRKGVNSITYSRTGTTGISPIRVKFRDAFSTEGSP